MIEYDKKNLCNVLNFIKTNKENINENSEWNFDLYFTAENLGIDENELCDIVEFAKEEKLTRGLSCGGIFEGKPTFIEEGTPRLTPEGREFLEQQEKAGGLVKMTDYEKLKKIIDEIDELIAREVKGSSESCRIWQVKVETFLQEYYGKKSQQYEDFRNTRFSLFFHDNSTPEQKFIDACKKDLVATKAVFANYLKDMSDGVEKESSDTAAKDNKTDNKPWIFLSHRSTDKKHGNVLQKFITGLGVPDEQLIYTSHHLHLIPEGKKIDEYLREGISGNAFVIFLWSDSYLESPACLNEMGAVWVAQKEYSNIYVSSSVFKNPKYNECMVDTTRMGIVLDGSKECKARFIDLKKKIMSLFNLNTGEQRGSHLIDEAMDELKAMGKS